MAHRDTMLEALHADALDGLLAKGKLPEKARLAIADKALKAREKVKGKAVKK
jgi:hypothetical protein